MELFYQQKDKMILGAIIFVLLAFMLCYFYMWTSKNKPKTSQLHKITEKKFRCNQHVQVTLDGKTWMDGWVTHTDPLRIASMKGADGIRFDPRQVREKIGHARQDYQTMSLEEDVGSPQTQSLTQDISGVISDKRVYFQNISDSI
jgi:hypothetical protein